MRKHTQFALISLFLAVSTVAVAADNAPEPAKKDAAAAATSGPRLAEFQKVRGEWNTVMGDLATIKVQYRSADATQRADLQKKWTALLEKAYAKQDQLIDAAQKAYIDAPNANKEVTELLMVVLAERVQRDDYEAAFPVGKLLLDNNCEDKQVADYAGAAAFSIGELDAAEKYLKMAEKNKSLTETNQRYLAGMDRSKAAWENEKKIRAAEAKADDLPRVLLKTTHGDIELELFENEAPNSVANFITLVEKGFYNGLTFHRVLPGFMAQGGDPKGNGGGGPGYSIAAEFTKPDHRLHFRGSLAMARSQDADSAGSQFYLMFAPRAELDGHYTVFGRIVKGFDVLAKIQRIDPDSPDDSTPDKIIEAKVLRKRPHKYVVKKVSE